MIIYLIIVLFIIFSLAFNVDKNKRIKKCWMFFTFSILTLVSAIRSYNVGVDTQQYYSAFKIIALVDWSQTDVFRYEIGYFYLNKLISVISNNPQILLVITSCFIIPSVGFFIYKYSNNVVKSTLLYILFNIFFFHMTGLRQSIAISILIFAIQFVEKKKYIIFALLILIASLFHSSSVVFLLVILIDKMKYKNRTYFYTLLIMIGCFIFLKPLFMFITKMIGKYSGYIDNKEFGVSNYFGAFFQFLLTFVVYTFCHVVFIKNKHKRNDINIQNINELSLKLIAMDVVVQCMAMKMNIIGRLNQFFWIYSIVLIPNLLYYIKDKKVRIFLNLCVIIIAFTYWLIIGIFRPEWNGAIPYSVF